MKKLLIISTLALLTATQNVDAAAAGGAGAGGAMASDERTGSERFKGSVEVHFSDGSSQYVSGGWAFYRFIKEKKIIGVVGVTPKEYDYYQGIYRKSETVSSVKRGSKWGTEENPYITR